MNLDLISIYERNKKIEKKEQELDEQKEINRLIKYVLDNNSEYKTNENKLIDKIGLKYINKKTENFFGINYMEYIVKLNKSNIKIIQDYINKLGESNE